MYNETAENILPRDGYMGRGTGGERIAGRLRMVTCKDERFVSRYIANAIYCIIWKYRDIAIFRKYRDILTIFSVHDIGQFLPFMDPQWTIVTP